MIGETEFFGQIKEKCSYRAMEFVNVLTLKKKDAIDLIHAGSSEDIVSGSLASLVFILVVFKRTGEVL